MNNLFQKKYIKTPVIFLVIFSLLFQSIPLLRTESAQREPIKVKYPDFCEIEISSPEKVLPTAAFKEACYLLKQIYDISANEVYLAERITTATRLFPEKPKNPDEIEGESCFPMFNCKTTCSLSLPEVSYKLDLIEWSAIIFGSFGTGAIPEILKVLDSIKKFLDLLDLILNLKDCVKNAISIVESFNDIRTAIFDEENGLIKTIEDINARFSGVGLSDFWDNLEKFEANFASSTLKADEISDEIDKINNEKLEKMIDTILAFINLNNESFESIVQQKLNELALLFKVYFSSNPKGLAENTVSALRELNNAFRSIINDVSIDSINAYQISPGLAEALAAFADMLNSHYSALEEKINNLNSKIQETEKIGIPNRPDIVCDLKNKISEVILEINKVIDEASQTNSKLAGWGEAGSSYISGVRPIMNRIISIANNLKNQLNDNILNKIKEIENATNRDICESKKDLENISKIKKIEESLNLLKNKLSEVTETISIDIKEKDIDDKINSIINEINGIITKINSEKDAFKNRYGIKEEEFNEVTIELNEIIPDIEEIRGYMKKVIVVLNALGVLADTARIWNAIAKLVKGIKGFVGGIKGLINCIKLAISKEGEPLEVGDFKIDFSKIYHCFPAKGFYDDWQGDFQSEIDCPTINEAFKRIGLNLDICEGKTSKTSAASPYTSSGAAWRMGGMACPDVSSLTSELVSNYFSMTYGATLGESETKTTGLLRQIINLKKQDEEIEKIEAKAREIIKSASNLQIWTRILGNRASNCFCGESYCKIVSNIAKCFKNEDSDFSKFLEKYQIIALLAGLNEIVCPSLMKAAEFLGVKTSELDNEYWNDYCLWPNFFYLIWNRHFDPIIFDPFFSINCLTTWLIFTPVVKGLAQKLEQEIIK